MLKRKLMAPMLMSWTTDSVMVFVSARHVPQGDSSDDEYTSPGDPRVYMRSLLVNMRHSLPPPSTAYCPAAVRSELPHNTCPRPSSLYSLQHSRTIDYDYWSKQVLSQAERKVLNKSRKDRKP